jgi:hypothetical protein
MGGRLWPELLGSAELASTTDSRGGNGCADPISACLLRLDVLDAVPEIRTVEGRFFAGDELSTRDRRSLGTKS